MSGGCTNCGQKGGCDSRKHEMFGAIDEALARLYPTRRWDERDETAGFGAGLGPGEGDALAAAAGARLHAATLYRPGGPEETCDYVYILCVGRAPSLVELRAAALDGAAGEAPRAVAEEALRATLAEGPVTEVYLRVALSTLAPFAAVQEVVLSATVDAVDGTLALIEAPRARDLRADPAQAAAAAGRPAGRTEHPPPRLRGDHRAPRGVRSRQLRRSSTAAPPASPTTSSIRSRRSAIATTTLT